jgi:hypothetical protein
MKHFLPGKLTSCSHQRSSSCRGFNEDDPTGHLLEKAKHSKDIQVFHISLPAEASANVKPAELKEFYVDGLLDPKRLNHEAIRKLRAKLGTYGASGQLDQLPSPAEGGILKKRWFGIVGKSKFPGMQLMKFRLDTAYTEKQTNDPTGFFAYFMENGFMYVVKCRRALVGVSCTGKIHPDILPGTMDTLTGPPLRWSQRHQAKVLCRN